MVLDSTWRVRYSMMLLIALSGVALVLAALGVYGVLHYTVGKRSKEIGIRIALGPDRSSIAGMVLREGLSVAGLGFITVMSPGTFDGGTVTKPGGAGTATLALSGGTFNSGPASSRVWPRLTPLSPLAFILII
jgi:hypothetical protein